MKSDIVKGYLFLVLGVVGFGAVLAGLQLGFMEYGIPVLIGLWEFTKWTVTSIPKTPFSVLGIGTILVLLAVLVGMNLEDPYSKE